MQIPSVGQEDPLEEGMATLSSILAWRIPWTEETGGLWSTGSQRVHMTEATGQAALGYLEYGGSHQCSELGKRETSPIKSSPLSQSWNTGNICPTFRFPSRQKPQRCNVASVRDTTRPWKQQQACQLSFVPRGLQASRVCRALSGLNQVRQKPVPWAVTQKIGTLDVRSNSSLLQAEAGNWVFLLLSLH